MTATVHHPAATLVTVTFAGADGKTQAIVCTPEHPFFVDGKGWVEAGSLGIGTSIVTRAGPMLAVKSLDWKRSDERKAAFTVYNFTVEASHTFFVGTANGGAWTHNSGCEFSIKNWSGYPQGVPKPSGPYRILEEAEYDAARNAANNANRALRNAQDLAGHELHEIHPVKFGGDPIDPANKLPMTRGDHSAVTTWWNGLQKAIGY